MVGAEGRGFATVKVPLPQVVCGVVTADGGLFAAAHPVGYRIGETTTIMDPATGEPITVRVDAIGNGKATITVVALPGTSVTKVRDGEDEPEPRVLH